MFVSFNKIFNKKPQSQTEVPPAMIEQMNKQLPEGVRYISSEDGMCTIVSDSGTYNIGGIIFKPTEEQRKILGRDYTRDDLLEYFYNAQKPILLELKNDGYITLNGKEISIDKMHYNPFLPVKSISGRFFAFPQKFPAPFSLTVGDSTYSRVLAISRIPNESVHVAKFESKEHEPLRVRFSVDKKNRKISMNMTYNLKYAKSIHDIVECISIYNAYVDGNAVFGSAKLDVISLNKDNKKFPPKSVLFWEKVLKIEECLKVSFVPPKKDVSGDDVVLVEELYQNLIERVPVRDTQQLTSIGGNWDLNYKNREIKESIGLPVFFSFHSIAELELFGAKFSLLMLTGVCNAKIKEIIPSDKKTKLVLEDECEEKKQYMCNMFFLTETEMEEYMSVGVNELITVFESAKTVQELMS